MKKLRRMSLIFLIPFITGFILLFFSGPSRPEMMKAGEILVGLVSPILMALVVIIGIIMLVKGKINLQEGKESNKVDEDVENLINDIKPIEEDGEEADAGSEGWSRRDEEELINDINNSSYYENQMNNAKFSARHAANNYKNTSTKGKVFGTLFLVLILADVVLAIIFFYFNIIIGAMICIGVFAAAILTSMIVVKTAERRSLKFDVNKLKDTRIYCGEVKACMLSSSTSVGDSDRGHSRITGVVYKVIVEYEGNSYTAFSRDFYENGEKVRFAILGKNRAGILTGDFGKEDQGEEDEI